MKLISCFFDTRSGIVWFNSESDRFYIDGSTWVNPEAEFLRGRLPIPKSQDRPEPAAVPEEEMKRRAKKMVSDAFDASIKKAVSPASICGDCSGTGIIVSTGNLCCRCLGTGLIHLVCPNCRGFGETSYMNPCATCNGFGRVPATKEKKHGKQS